MRPSRLLARQIALSFALMGSFVPTAAEASVVYTYDPVGRVVTALYDNNVCIVYAYDANGNRTAQVINAAGTPNSGVWGTGILGCFRYST